MCQFIFFFSHGYDLFSRIKFPPWNYFSAQFIKTFCIEKTAPYAIQHKSRKRKRRKINEKEKNKLGCYCLLGYKTTPKKLLNLIYYWLFSIEMPKFKFTTVYESCMMEGDNLLPKSRAYAVKTCVPKIKSKLTDTEISNQHGINNFWWFWIWTEI